MSDDDWQPPTEEEIRKRAYGLYLERKRYSAGALDDWLEAEAELWMRRSSTDPSSKARRPANRATRGKG
jgi:hypothetical protein